MIKFKEASNDQLDNFSFISETIVNFVKKHWDCVVKPKGYDEFIENYEDFDGMEELDGEALKEDFKGFNDATSGSMSFPIKIALPHTAYDDKCQGRDSIETLLGAVLGHGMMVGDERRKRKALKSLEKIESTINIYKKYGESDEVKEMITAMDFEIEMIKMDLIR